MRIAATAPTSTKAPVVDVPNATATASPTAKPPAAEPDFAPVPVSDEPEQRYDQLVGFFHRNPGWVKTGNTADTLRGAFDELGKVGELVRDLTEPADVGYGQAIRDQTRWQIDTGRQPDNPWWLRMNQGLVQDPLTAERAVRNGTVDQLQTAGQKAWAEYVRRSDMITRAMGLEPGSDAVDGAAERGQPIALSDTWKGVSPLKRAYVQMVLKPYARKALWVAHRKTLEDGRPVSVEQGKAMHRKAPREMNFSSAWATFIGYYSYLSPPLTGNQSKLAQKLILPTDHPVDPDKQHWLKNLWLKFSDAVDPEYEREIARPADAEDAAKAGAAA